MTNGVDARAVRALGRGAGRATAPCCTPRSCLDRRRARLRRGGGRAGLSGPCRRGRGRPRRQVPRAHPPAGGPANTGHDHARARRTRVRPHHRTVSLRPADPARGAHQRRTGAGRATAALRRGRRAGGVLRGVHPARRRPAEPAAPAAGPAALGRGHDPRRGRPRAAVAAARAPARGAVRADPDARAEPQRQRLRARPRPRAWCSCRAPARCWRRSPCSPRPRRSGPGWWCSRSRTAWAWRSRCSRWPRPAGRSWPGSRRCANAPLRCGQAGGAMMVATALVIAFNVAEPLQRLTPSWLAGVSRPGGERRRRSAPQLDALAGGTAARLAVRRARRRAARPATRAEVMTFDQCEADPSRAGRLRPGARADRHHRLAQHRPAHPGRPARQGRARSTSGPTRASTASARCRT